MNLISIGLDIKGSWIAFGFDLHILKRNSTEAPENQLKGLLAKRVTYGGLS